MLSKKRSESRCDEGLPSVTRSAERVHDQAPILPPFYVAPTPVILCEGSTDNVYLIHAIRRHSATYPKLPTKNADGTIDIGVRIYKYVDKTTGQILGPGGGASHFGHLMNIYQAATKKFSARVNTIL